MALDSISAVLNIRGHYGYAEPIDRERVEITRLVREPFEISDTYYTAGWSALEVGNYRVVVALAAEFEALNVDVAPLGQLANSVIARLPLGDWDEALAEQARLRELFGEAATRPPSFASGGHGAEALIHELRGEEAAADAVLDEIDGWEAGGERPRLWANPLAAIAVARRGDFARAHAYLAQLVGKHGIYLARELEARCTLIAEEGDWSEAAALITRARRHADVARLLALAVHADRLEGRALLASGNAEAACVCLERAVAGFHELGAAWERARHRARARRGVRGARPRRRCGLPPDERRGRVRAPARATRVGARAGADQPPAGISCVRPSPSSQPATAAVTARRSVFRPWSPRTTAT